MSYSPIEFSALFGVPGVRVQIPPDTQNGLLASVVRLEKFEGVKSPETVDAVGVQPTASKLFGSFGLSLRNHYLRKALRRNGFRRSAQLFKPIQRQIGCPPNHAQAIFVLELPDGWVVKLSEQSWMMAVLQSPHGQKIEKRIPASEQRRQISDVVWVRTVIRIVMGHRDRKSVV